MSGRCDGTFNCDKLVTNQLEIPPGAIAAEASVGRYTVHHSEPAGTAVTSKSTIFHHFAEAGKVREVNLQLHTAPDGGDRQYTVEVKKGSAGAPSTILTGAITADNADTDYAVLVGTLTSSPVACAAGDFLMIEVTASGSSGTQGQGFCLSVVIDQDPV